jgi:hypothetical protein
MEDLSIYCEDYSDWRTFKMYIEAISEYNLKLWTLQHTAFEIQNNLKNNLPIDSLLAHIKIAEGHADLARININRYKDMLVEKEHKKPMTKEDADNIDKFVSSLATRSSK